MLKICLLSTGITILPLSNLTSFIVGVSDDAHWLQDVALFGRLSPVYPHQGAGHS